MKEETGFAVIVTSQIPVFIGWRKLVLFSPDTGITPPGAAESKGLQLFFHSISAWHTGLWGQAEIISFPLSFYTTSQAHYTCANSNTHIQRNFLLGLNRQFRKMPQKSSEGRLVQSETSKQYHCSSIVRSLIHWL